MADEHIAPHQHRWAMLLDPPATDKAGMGLLSPMSMRVMPNSSCDICGLTPEAVANQAAVKEAIAEVISTAKENAALREIAEAVAAVSWAEYCPWCNRHGAIREVQHDDDCPVLAARELTGVTPDEDDE